MAAFRIVNYSAEHFEGVRALWRQAFPDNPQWNMGEIAATAKLPAWADLFFIAQDAEEVVGSIMAGFDGHQGWLYAVAVLRSHRRQRLGSALVREAEARLAAMGCVKCGLQIGLANREVVGFYSSLGYAIEACVSMEKNIAGMS